MTINQSELDSFHNFASSILAKAGRDVELEELISQWRAEREGAETLSSIRRGAADAAAGRVHDLAEVDARTRSELGLPARR